MTPDGILRVSEGAGRVSDGEYPREAAGWGHKGMQSIDGPLLKSNFLVECKS